MRYNTNYLPALPPITVYMNCDTILAIDLRAFELTDMDEFIFTIKNHDYIESPYVFTFRAKASDINSETGEAIFTIPPITTRQIKSGAVYNFAALVNAFDSHNDTIYQKLTENGKIEVDFGAQNLIEKAELTDFNYEIVSIELKPIQEPSYNEISGLSSMITDVRLEPVEPESEDLL